MLNKRKIFVVALSFFLLSSTALAADFMVPGNGEQNVTVSANEIHKNLYVAGGNVTVNGLTRGDLYVAGGMVSVIGDVEQDANVAGGSLSLSGKIGGDARIGGGNITISSPIAGDLLLAGGNLTLTEKASVGGDLIVGGGNIIIDSPVKGKVRIGGGNITINSKIDGDVEIVSSGNGRNHGGVIFGSRAEVLGSIKLKAEKEAVIKDGAKVSTINFTQYEKKERALAGLLTMALLIKIVGMFIAGLILIKFRKNALRAMATSISGRPWENLGIGLAGLFLIPVLAILALVTFVGYYVAALLGVAYALLLLVAGLVEFLFVGSWLMKRIKKTPEFVFDLQTAAVGVIAVSILSFIPYIGWLACFILFLFSVGAVIKLARGNAREEN